MLCVLIGEEDVGFVCCDEVDVIGVVDVVVANQENECYFWVSILIGIFLWFATLLCKSVCKMSVRKISVRKINARKISVRALIVRAISVRAISVRGISVRSKVVSRICLRN